MADRWFELMFVRCCFCFIHPFQSVFSTATTNMINWRVTYVVDCSCSISSLLLLIKMHKRYSTFSSNDNRNKHRRNQEKFCRTTAYVESVPGKYQTSHYAAINLLESATNSGQSLEGLVKKQQTATPSFVRSVQFMKIKRPLWKYINLYLPVSTLRLGKCCMERTGLACWMFASPLAQARWHCASQKHDFTTHLSLISTR